MRKYTYISIVIIALVSFTFATFAEATPLRKHKSEHRNGTHQKVAQKRITASQAKSIARQRVRDAQVIDVMLSLIHI